MHGSRENKLNNIRYWFRILAVVFCISLCNLLRTVGGRKHSYFFYHKWNEILNKACFIATYISANQPINSHGVKVSITELLEIKIWGYHRAGNGELRLSKAGLLWSEE